MKKTIPSPTINAGEGIGAETERLSLVLAVLTVLILAVLTLLVLAVLLLVLILVLIILIGHYHVPPVERCSDFLQYLLQ